MNLYGVRSDGGGGIDCLFGNLSRDHALDLAANLAVACAVTPEEWESRVNESPLRPIHDAPAGPTTEIHGSVAPSTSGAFPGVGAASPAPAGDPTTQ